MPRDLKINYCITDCEREIKSLWTEIRNLKKLVYQGGPSRCCVVSVNGKDGVVVLTTSDIAEGTNKYYTNSRVQAFSDPRYAFKTHTHLLSEIIDFPPPSSHAGEFLTTDGTTVFWQPVSPGSSYTNEQAQDAVGNILVDSNSIDFIYDDYNNSITANVKQAYIQALVSQAPIFEIRFTVGATDSPQEGDTTFTVLDGFGTPMIGKKIDFYREREYQIVKDGRDYTINLDTAEITVTVPFTSGEDCVLKCYSFDNYSEVEYGTLITGFPYTLPLILS